MCKLLLSAGGGGCFSLSLAGNIAASSTNNGSKPSSSSSYLSTFFTIARFGPDTMVILGALAAATVVLFYSGFPDYLPLATASVLGVIFLVESVETISLERPYYRQILGARCFVVKKAGRVEKGIVKLYTPEGVLENELWSSESEIDIPEGDSAVVVGMRSAILEIAAPSTARD